MYNYTEEAIQVSMQNMDDLRKALAEDLEGKQGMLLPAAGVFFFKNPILGHNGDLLCNLSYKDTPSAYFSDGDGPIINKDGAEKVTVAGAKEGKMPEAPATIQVPLPDRT